MNISTRSFGTAPDGSEASLYTIENASGMSLSLTDWGAAIVSVRQPDRRGSVADVVLGFNDAASYRRGRGYQGATCGRFANRIAGGRFKLDGRVVELSCNNGPNHLHGGDSGFNERIWSAEPYVEGDCYGIKFTYVSPDGEENYPGELKVVADYALDEEGRLSMEYRAETDRATIVNITNHAYWNLGGVDSGTILDHLVRFNSSSYVPVDPAGIPTGRIDPVEGTPFDFRFEKPIRRDMDGVPGGYDHCMVIDGERGELRKAAEVTHPDSGRRLVLYTDRPGVQFYTGNFLKGEPFPRNAGLCLEPEDFPDAPNRPNFPSVVLRPGDFYLHRSYFELSAL